jgi:hypothetical protein
LGVCFGPLDDRCLRVDVDDPHAQELVTRLRGLPGYRHEQEQRAKDMTVLVFLREQTGTVEAPVRVPSVASAASLGAYRD